MLLFDDKDCIVFAGDSVTDMGSAIPVGIGPGDSLGHGFVRQLENLLGATYPQLSFKIVNSGISGNTSRDLKNRFERDVLSYRPDWVAICIGINDVWRQFDRPAQPEIAPDPQEYRANLKEMLDSLRGNVKGIFLLTPYYMEPMKDDPMRKRMDEYTAILKELSEEYGCLFVDFQSAFDTYLANKHSSYLAWDRIHPNQMGAMLMAKTFLAKTGFEF